jgi:alpha-tubulin suppressor-like RCC1 family protein
MQPRGLGIRGRSCGWRLRAAVTTLGLVAACMSVAGTAASGPASAGPVPVVSSGGGGSCTLMPDQTVWCWGSNATGQLGNGTIQDSMTPVKVSTLGPATGVSAGQSDNALSAFNHACAVETTSQVFCWGSNTFGELGRGTISQDNPWPLAVSGGLLASQVSAGDGFTCAVTLAQTVKCWGDGNDGQLGNGTFTDSSTPVKVKGLANVTQVAAGYFHACALESNGTVWCWGDNTFGSLGNGSTTDSDVPVQVGVQNATYVAAGSGDSCAIADRPGDLLCWGANNVGQLGTGTFTDESVPTQVASLSSGVQQVTMGIDFTCALADIPQLAGLCWGDNGGSGKLGNGTFNKPSSDPFPGQVFGLAQPPAGGAGGPVQISAGSDHACVVMTTAVVQCWGEGSIGRLGDGDTLDRDIPTPVIGLPSSAASVSEVTAGIATSCAVTSALEVHCWGQYVGDGSGVLSVHTSAVLTQSAATQVSAGWGGCALVHLGGLSTEVRCWGTDKNGQIGDGLTGIDAKQPRDVKNLSDPQYVTNGGGDNCALVHNGGAWCWGYNGYGELGNGTTTSSNVPVPVSGLPLNLAQIAAGFEHTCALLKNGTVDCWGENNHGQLGNGSTSGSNTPVPVTGLTGVVQIAVADSGTCALTNAGGVWCWGANLFGELGNGTTTDSDVPVSVSGLSSGAVSIGASDSTVCAALSTGQVDCWGDNSVGELGTGTVGSPPMSTTPVTVGGFTTSGSVGMSAGFGATSCALNASQQAFCWGDNTVGELGDGTSGAATDSGTPVAVQGL